VTGVDKDKNYRGSQRKTKSRIECQAWDSQTPHEHTGEFTPESNP
jgi:hypothetical protein